MSNSQIIPGGYPIPSLALVAVDNTSIFGSGSVEDPLRAGAGGGGTFLATYEVAGGRAALPGLVVVGSATAPDAGTITTVKAADALSGALADAQVIGLITEVLSPTEVRVQSTGLLTLTVAQWAAVGAIGGLAQSEGYWASGGVDNGFVDDVAPSGVNVYQVQVGVGVDATTMDLCCPAVPILSAVNTFTRTIARPDPGQLLHLGNAINTNGQKPIATTDVPTAAALGLCVALPDATHVTYQFTGVVDLPAATWDVVTGGAGGLTPGDYYYLSDATAGDLVTAPPAGPSFVTPIGVALSATELQLQVSVPKVGA